MCAKTKNVLSTLIVGTVFTAGLPLQALADQYHFNSTLVGDRAAGLGGAYVAVSDDPTGMYYNPAGIAYSSGSNLSASMNAFQYSKKTYYNVFGAGRNWERTSSGLIPNFFGVTQKFGPGILGFSYTVPDSSVENQDQTFKNVGQNGDLDFRVNFNNSDYTYNAGPSYAIAFGPKFSIGTTLYAYYKTQELILNQMISKIQNAQEFEWTNAYFQYAHVGIKPVFGAMYSPIEKVSIGMRYEFTKIVYTDSLEQIGYACSLTGTTGCTQPPELLTSIDARKEVLPNSEATSSFHMGVAFFPNPAWLLTTSMSYNSPLIGNYAVINAAAGAEYYFTPTLAIRTGVYTDKSATPPLESGTSALYNEHVDLYGFSLSFTNFSRTSSLTLGFNGSVGDGQSQIVAGGPIQNMDVLSLSVFMSALYSY